MNVSNNKPMKNLKLFLTFLLTFANTLHSYTYESLLSYAECYLFRPQQLLNEDAVRLRIEEIRTIAQNYSIDDKKLMLELLHRADIKLADAETQHRSYLQIKIALGCIFFGITAICAAKAFWRCYHHNSQYADWQKNVTTLEQQIIDQGGKLSIRKSYFRTELHLEYPVIKRPDDNNPLWGVKIGDYTLGIDASYRNSTLEKISTKLADVLKNAPRLQSIIETVAISLFPYLGTILSLCERSSPTGQEDILTHWRRLREILNQQQENL